MYTIRKKFKFEGAHILSDSYSKECQRIHGHSYVVELFLSTEKLNEDGMVIDFKKLKEIVNPIIQQWDHRLLIENGFDEISYKWTTPVPFNPTAENMCKYLFDVIDQELPYGIEIKVRIHETDTGYAEYSRR